MNFVQKRLLHKMTDINKQFEMKTMTTEMRQPIYYNINIQHTSKDIPTQLYNNSSNAYIEWIDIISTIHIYILINSNNKFYNYIFYYLVESPFEILY